MTRSKLSPARRTHGKAYRWLCPASVVVMACGDAPVPPLRALVPHRVSGCGSAQGSTLLFSALGDFSAPLATSASTSAPGEVSLPFDLRGVEAETLPLGFHGIGYSAPPDDVHFTMWETARACDLLADGEPAIPPSRGGQALTVFGGGDGLLLAGLEPPATRIQDAAFALAWNTRTGQRVASLANGMRIYRRAFATATPFGQGALVAGGMDPKFLPEQPVNDALVFRDGDFLQATIGLDEPRARHGAVVLASGETLLVGGEGANGTVLSSLVAITENTKSGADVPGEARIFGLGSLRDARKIPQVMRLSDDKILVAGGRDQNDFPVASLEWFLPDGSSCNAPTCTVSGIDGDGEHSFIALSGGGALAVGGRATSTADANTVALARDVWWITPDAIYELPHLSEGQRGTSPRVRLVAAQDGAPWMWNGQSWLRFDPWQETFVTPDDAPESGPDDDLPEPIAIDPGLFVWLERSDSHEASAPRLRGFRHGVRGPWTHDHDFFLVEPYPHLVPNVPPHTGDLTTGPGGLTLAHQARVTVADTDYGDVVITGEMPAPGSFLPHVLLGPTVVGAGCPWPQGAVGKTFSVDRHSDTIDLTVDDVAHSTCQIPIGRISIALAATGDVAVTVSRLKIDRR